MGKEKLEEERKEGEEKEHVSRKETSCIPQHDCKLYVLQTCAFKKKKKDSN